MKKREKEFCRLMAVYAQPERAARESGYRDPSGVWPTLVCRKDIAEEIAKNTASMCSIAKETALSGVYQLAFGGVSDAVRLLYREQLTDEEIEGLDLSCVAEIKRSKDKSIEVKFFDRLKALDRLRDGLNSQEELNSSGGLLEAMALSAKALGRLQRSGEDDDAV